MFWEQANIKSNGIETIRIQILQCKTYRQAIRKQISKWNKMKKFRLAMCRWECVGVSVCVFGSAQIRRYPNPVKVSRETRNKHDNIVARNKIEKVE